MKNVFQAPVMVAMFALAIVQFPIEGMCDGDQRRDVVSLFESKGKAMKEVATEVVTLPEDEDIRGLDFSPDGKFLATTSTQMLAVRVWDWRNRRIVRTFERPKGSNLLSTEPVRFSPDGRLLASCSSRSGPNNSVTRIWNAATGDVVIDIDEPSNGGCEAIAFSSDGKYLIQAMLRFADLPGNSLIINDTQTWQPVWGLRTVPFYPNHLAISPDGKLVAIAGEVINPDTWPFDTPRPTFGTPPLPNQPLILIVDLEGHKIVRTIKAGAERVDWSPDGKHIVAGGGADPIVIFDARSGAVFATEQGEAGHVLVRYTPDGKYLIERINLRVKIWDGQHRELYQEIPAAPGVLAVSRDGHYLAMGGDKKVIVWQLK